MNDQLNKIEELMVRRIETAKLLSNFNHSRMAEMHALSEALNEIRKVIKEKSG